MIARRREYMVPMDTLRFCGIKLMILWHSSPKDSTPISEFRRQLPVHYLMHDVNVEHHLLLLD